MSQVLNTELKNDVRLSLMKLQEECAKWFLEKGPFQVNLGLPEENLCHLVKIQGISYHLSQLLSILTWITNGTLPTYDPAGLAKFAEFFKNSKENSAESIRLLARAVLIVEGKLEELYQECCDDDEEYINDLGSYLGTLNYILELMM